MKKIINHSKPTIIQKDIKAVSKVLLSGNIAQGRMVLSFEKNFAKYHNLKKAVALNSGTSALHLALLSLNIKKGDEVIIPSFVCTALLNAVNYTGAKPVIVDVNEHDFNISAIAAKKKINKKVKAIIVPHMFGNPADLKSLKSLGVPIIEDCAQAIGAKYYGNKVGSIGDLSIFSFYATKVLTTAEGGMVVSKNNTLLNKIRDLREYDKKMNYAIRFNYKMSDMQAALGISQLKQLQSYISKRRMIASQYNKAFKNYEIELPVENKGCRHIYYRYVVKVKKSRDLLMKRLNQKGIKCCLPVNKPLHIYANQRGCKTSEEIMKQVLSIPIYPSMSNKDVSYIIKTVKGLC